MILSNEVLLDGGEIPEGFVLTVTSGSDSSFILPTCGKLNNINNTYSWNINWGDGSSVQQVSGMGRINSDAMKYNIPHSYPKSNTVYNIQISPQNPKELGWLRAFSGFSPGGESANNNAMKILKVSGELTEQMIRISPTDSSVCSTWFQNCYNLTMGKNFNLPQGITTVGKYFCSSMFNGCSGSSFKMNNIFNIPQRITTVDDGFCSNLFTHCKGSSFKMNNIFQIPQGITTVGTNFCRQIFANCTGSSFIHSNLRIPQGITTVGAGFFTFTFLNCSNLRTGVLNLFGGENGILLSTEELNKSEVFNTTFSSCSSIQEVITVDNCRQLSISPSIKNRCFENSNPSAIVDVPINWK